MSRRGISQEIFTDNGTAFVSEMMQRFAAERKVKWYRNVPKAPWMGGFYERLVQSVKRCLKRAVGSVELTYVELQTILAEIELILNSRPLGPILDDAQKRKNERNEPKINDVVIVEEDKTPRSTWNLGKIVELCPSRDKKIRAVKILIGKTKNVIKRPVNKLYPIERADN